MHSAEAGPLTCRTLASRSTAGMSEGAADCDLEPCSSEECERAVSAPELLELEPLAHSLLTAKPGQPAASPAESSPLWHQSPSHRSSAFLSQGLASPQQCSTPKRLSGTGDDGPLGSPLMGIRTQVSLCMSNLHD